MSGEEGSLRFPFLLAPLPHACLYPTGLNGITSGRVPLPWFCPPVPASPQLSPVIASVRPDLPRLLLFWLTPWMGASPSLLCSYFPPPLLISLILPPLVYLLHSHTAQKQLPHLGFISQTTAVPCPTAGIAQGRSLHSPFAIPVSTIFSGPAKSRWGRAVPSRLWEGGGMRTTEKPWQLSKEQQMEMCTW